MDLSGRFFTKIKGGTHQCAEISKVFYQSLETTKCLIENSNVESSWLTDWLTDCLTDGQTSLNPYGPIILPI